MSSPTQAGDEPPLPSRMVTVVGVSRDVTGFRFTGGKGSIVFLPTTLDVPKTRAMARVSGDPDLARQTLLDHLTRIDPNMGMIVTMRTVARLERFFLNLAVPPGGLDQQVEVGARLARYHADVDSAFWGWNRIWLAPEFRDWNIEEYLPRIRCPVLAIQGVDDEYGTMEQVRRIEAGVADVELLPLQRCRHSPHRDQPDAVLAAIARFVDRVVRQPLV